MNNTYTQMAGMEAVLIINWNYNILECKEIMI